MIPAAVLRTQIQKVLTTLDLYSVDAEELLMATCAQESLLGTYRTQAPHGPARGIFQVEGNTFDDLFTNYLQYHPKLLGQTKALFKSQPPTVDELVNNDPAAILIARLCYYRHPQALPAAGDIEAIWSFYKRWYNGPGAAEHDQFLANYKRLC